LNNTGIIGVLLDVNHVIDGGSSVAVTADQVEIENFQIFLKRAFTNFRVFITAVANSQDAKSWL